jgi:flagellar motor switch protein FliG
MPQIPPMPKYESTPDAAIYTPNNAAVVEPADVAVPEAKPEAVETTETTEVTLDEKALELVTAPATEEPAQDEEKKPTAKISYEELDAALKEYTGYNMADIAVGAKMMEQFAAEKAKSQLLEVVGDEANLNRVVEHFAKLTPQQQAALDNPQGAKLIWSYLQQQDATKAAPKAPKTDRSRSDTSSANGSSLTREQILAMSPDEQAKRYPEIIQFYTRGNK